MLYFKKDDHGKGNSVWRFLKDNENNDNEFDIYSIMKSKTMREYYRNNIKLSLGGMINIIGYSYNPINVKIRYLENLKEYCLKNLYSLEDIKSIDSCINYFSSLLNILGDTREYLYVLKTANFVCNDFKFLEYKSFPYYLSEYIEDGNVYLFKSIEEVYKTINDYKSSDFTFYLDVYTLDAKKYVSYTIKYFNDTINIIWAKYQLTDNDILFNTYRYYIPYKDWDLINIKIPGFNVNINGYIKKELADDWYTCFYGEDTNNCEIEFDLSSISLNLGMPYSIFDIIV